jgi:hypothetical protein
MKQKRMFYGGAALWSGWEMGGGSWQRRKRRMRWGAVLLNGSCVPDWGAQRWDNKRRCSAERNGWLPFWSEPRQRPLSVAGAIVVERVQLVRGATDLCWSPVMDSPDSFLVFLASFSFSTSLFLFNTVHPLHVRRFFSCSSCRILFLL